MPDSPGSLFAGGRWPHGDARLHGAGPLRYDTVVAKAFRAALGIAGATAPKPGMRSRGARRYGHMLECFRNEGRAPFERAL